MRVLTELTSQHTHVRYVSSPHLADHVVMVTVSLADFEAVRQVAKRWAWWDRPALMRFADGHYGYDTLVSADREIQRAVRQAPYLTSDEYAGVVRFLATVQRVTVNVGTWNERKVECR